jgi:hypothetical protein
VCAIAHNQGLAMGAVFSNPQVSIHKHDFATHLDMVRAVVLSEPCNKTFEMEC